jgi:TolB-like protein/DNA-binding winged helix-turn-helix (wHTH) protein/Flp pilus assembly protein TadD
MDALDRSGAFQFEGFRLDRQARVLLRCDEAGAFVPMAVGSRAFDVLDALVGRAGELVSRDELMSAVWPTTVVEDTNLNMQIAALRRILDEVRADGSCIQTIPGRGYRFAVPVTPVEAASPLAPGGQSGNGADAERAPSQPGAAPPPLVLRMSRKRLWGGGPVLVAGALCLLAVAAMFIIWHQLQSGTTGTVPRRSIVVLPFANLSGDPEQQYFADGITEDLTTDLLRMPNWFVISRNTASTYRAKPVDIKEVARELGVHYVVAGSVQRWGKEVRISAQLINAETDAQLWAERFDRDLGNLLALQNDITTRISMAIAGALTEAEAARPVEHPDAPDLVFQGWTVMRGPKTRERYATAVAVFERAVALDPGSARASSSLANVLANRVMEQMTDTPAADLARSDELASRALSIAPRSSNAHFVKGSVLRAQGRCGEAIPEYEIALALDRNNVSTMSHLGWCKLLMGGSIEEAITVQERAVQLDPREWVGGVYLTRIGLARLLLSQAEEAVPQLERARSLVPAQPGTRAALAAAYGLVGSTGGAAAELAEARRLFGDDRLSSIASFKQFGFWGTAVPKVRALVEATYFAGLRKAGVPEE